MYRFAGKARRMTLGAYPSVGLATARVAFAEAKRKLDHGEDPGVLATAERRAERDASTVSQLINEYLARSAKGLRSSSEVKRILERNVRRYGATRRSSRSATRCRVVADPSWIEGSNHGEPFLPDPSNVRLCSEQGDNRDQSLYRVEAPSREIERERII
jgi:hypothetical protein